MNLGHRIAIVDHTDSIAHDDLIHVANALQRQVNEFVDRPSPYGYGIDCRVRVADSKRHPIRPDEWALGLFEHPDLAGALGYHDQTEFGLPLMKVFPFLDAKDNTPWSTTASHELLETLVDPNLARCVQAPDGKMYALEISDAVEADIMELDGVALSNFVLPPYFEPPKNLTGVRLDAMGLVKYPFEIRPGGYAQYWTGTRWRQETSSTPVRFGRRQMHHGGRSSRRTQKQPLLIYDADLIRVVDGDTAVLRLQKTYTMEVDFGFGIHDALALTKVTDQKFRVARINAPEVGSAGGLEAKQELERLLGLGPLHVTCHGQDKYGRWLGVITVETTSGSRDVGAAMIQGGFAVAYHEA